MLVRKNICQMPVGILLKWGKVVQCYFTSHEELSFLGQTSAQLLTLEHFQKMSEQMQNWPEIHVSSERQNFFRTSKWNLRASIVTMVQGSTNHGRKHVANMSFLQLRLSPARQCSLNRSSPLPDER